MNPINLFWQIKIENVIQFFVFILSGNLLQSPPKKQSVNNSDRLAKIPGFLIWNNMKLTGLLCRFFISCVQLRSVPSVCEPVSPQRVVISAPVWAESAIPSIASKQWANCFHWASRKQVTHFTHPKIGKRRERNDGNCWKAESRSWGKDLCKLIKKKTWKKH